MSILHKSCVSLLCSAKKIREIIKSEIGIEICDQDSLNIISACFGWQTWGAMHAAHQNKSNSHNWWHDMRWREKVKYLKARIPDVMESSNERWEWACQLGDRDKALLSLSLTNLLKPVDNLLNTETPPKSFIERIINKKQHKHSPYKDISSSRIREGFYIKSTDTLLLANHIENHLLPSQGDPDCFVVCESIALTDFIRTFKNRGYKVIVVDEIGKFENFKKRMGVEEKHLLPDIYTSSSSKFGLDAYLNHCIDFIIEEMPFLHLKESLARKLVELIAQLSRQEGNPTLNAPFLVIPSLKDVASLALNERETKEGKLSYELLSTIFLNPEKEPAFNKIANGESVPAFEENYHYETTPIYSTIKQLQSKFLDNFASCHKRSFSVFQREEGKVVYLFPFEDDDIKKQHLLATMHMLIDKMTISSQITKSDIWLFTPDYFNFMNSQGVPSFDFPALNKANINLFMFGDGKKTIDVFDTLIDVKGEQVLFEDNRAKILFGTS